MSEERIKSEKYTYVETDMDELRAFLGLTYYRGLLGLSKQTIKRLWAKNGHPIFAATMSRNRFKFLNSKISFDDRESREERWKSDRFAAIRKIF